MKSRVTQWPPHAQPLAQMKLQGTAETKKALASPDDKSFPPWWEYPLLNLTFITLSLLYTLYSIDEFLTISRLFPMLGNCIYMLPTCFLFHNIWQLSMECSSLILFFFSPLLGFLWHEQTVIYSSFSATQTAWFILPVTVINTVPGNILVRAACSHMGASVCGTDLKGRLVCVQIMRMDVIPSSAI